MSMEIIIADQYPNARTPNDVGIVSGQELTIFDLEDLNIALESLDEHFPDFDIDYAQGVLTMKLGDEHGTYVLNKQRPNMQIWWSSPTSGPKRFEYEKATGDWKSSRHGEEMLALLRGELLDIRPGIDVDFSDL